VSLPERFGKQLHHFKKRNMKTQIIIQIFLTLLAGGGITGIIKLPKKQSWVGYFIILLTIVGSILLWTIQ
jgi:hypothetical protein